MQIRKPELASILLITGSERNIGKTSLVCKAIKLFGRKNALTAIKVSAHFHEPTPDLKLLEYTNEYKIYQEFNATTGKDSSRMLKSGAKYVFYFEVEKGNIERAFNLFLEKYNPGLPIVCESTALASVIEPGIRLHVTATQSERNETSIENVKSLNLIQISFDGNSFTWPLSNLSLEKGNWKICSF